jgi:N-hydroxyarylamine O-acetyltransferase
MRAADAPSPSATHMALIVRIGGRDYLADTGFGNGTPTIPLAFDTSGPQPTPLETFRLRASPDGHVLEMRVGENWSPVYEMLAAVPDAGELRDANLFTSTHPDSRFRCELILARATVDRRYLLLGNRMTVRPSGNEAKLSIFRTRDELRHIVETVFLLPTEPDWQQVFERFTAPEMQNG